MGSPVSIYCRERGLATSSCIVKKEGQRWANQRAVEPLYFWTLVIAACSVAVKPIELTCDDEDSVQVVAEMLQVLG